jgi:hypothetical protein
MDHPTTPGIPRLHLTHPAPGGSTANSGHRLGILGGAYNPITFAHLALADAVVQTLGIHEVLFCLPEVPPHKTIFGAPAFTCTCFWLAFLHHTLGFSLDSKRPP